MPDAILDFLKTYGTNPLFVALLAAIVGILLGRFAPWIFAQTRRFGEYAIALLSGRRRDYQFERRYLNALITRYGSLGLLPSKKAVELIKRGVSQSVELEKVYVALAITPSGGGEPTASEGADAAAFMQRIGRVPHRDWRRFIPRRFWREAPQAQSDVGRVLEQQSRLVIRGDPGSGKTTLLKYLAVTCARARRNDTRGGDSRKLVRERLGWEKRPFPLCVSLGRHGDVTEWKKPRTLLDAFAEEFKDELPECPDGFFKRRLKRGNCLILLDAFDEIGSRTGREAMARQISGFLSADYYHPQNRVVVTTRVVGYEGQLDRLGFVVETVQPLTRRQTRELVKQRYRAYALQEAAHQPPERVSLLEREYDRRADRLIEQLGHNPRLRDLTENPLLLSLIILVRMADVELPEQRHLLYRDCVEILAENWRQHKREEYGLLGTAKDDLNLLQKIALLKNIALYMQHRRASTEDGRVMLLRRQVEAMIADQLPSLMAEQLPEDPMARHNLCAEKAIQWLDGIQQESGILQEIGHDSTTGEPLIRFLHLTFQEYLAALALRETPGEPVWLMENLLMESWQEVLLLYLAMSPERATGIVRQLLDRVIPADPRGLFISARALADKVTLDSETRGRILSGLADLVRIGEVQERVRGCELLATLGTSEAIALLAELVEGDSIFQVRDAAGQALGRLDDPRFENVEPPLVKVPAGEFMMGGDGKYDGKPIHPVNVPAFQIAKYPVTNMEYQRFVDATGHAPPDDWYESKFPEGKANHPVVSVSWFDTIAFCDWVSKQTGKKYRLPTEAEWEKAAGWDAAKNEKRDYPWGNEFDESKCNTSESGIRTTTPVGIYTDGASPCGAMDMTGNVWEWCADWYAENYYNSSPRENPRNDTPAQYRVLRGGSFLYVSDLARCASRLSSRPDSRFFSIGFRVCVSPA